MFDLEAAIAAWRQAAPAHSRTDHAILAEFEDHLREEFAARCAACAAPEEAWRLAAARLGDPADIDREFAKIARLAAIDRAALGGIVVLTAVCLVAVGAFAYKATVLQPRRELQGSALLGVHVASISLGYLLGLAAAIVASYSVLRGLSSSKSTTALSGVATRLVRTAAIAAGVLTVLGFVLGGVLSWREWGRPIMNDPREWAALVVLVAMAFAARRPDAGRDPRTVLAVAIAGGGAIFAAWFGLAAHTAGYPALLSVIGFGGAATCLALAAAATLAPRATTVQ